MINLLPFVGQPRQSSPPLDCHEALRDAQELANGNKHATAILEILPHATAAAHGLPSPVGGSRAAGRRGGGLRALDAGFA